MHLQAFQYLEQRSQNGNAPSAIVGRTGDDCLAFRRDANGQVIAVLFCEAKCTATHDAGLIKEAHEKLSVSAIVDVLRLVDVLRDSASADAQDWITALQSFHLSLRAVPPVFQRVDLLCYVHSSVPIRNATWITTNAPHSAYTGGRPLEVFEVRMTDVLVRLREIYTEDVWQ
jgi:hypothetical protein